MAASAFEKLKKAAKGVVTTGGSLVRTAGPVVSRVAGSVTSRVRGPGPGAPSTTEQAAGSDPRPPAAPVAQSPSPTPSGIARNVAKQRPVATPPRQRSTPTADDTPGDKLPPRRRPRASGEPVSE